MAVFVASGGGMTGEWRIGKDLEADSDSLIDVLSQCLLGVTEEATKCQKIGIVPAHMQARHFQDSLYKHILHAM
jgi:hypothetical protein